MKYEIMVWSKEKRLFTFSLYSDDILTTLVRIDSMGWEVADVKDVQG